MRERKPLTLEELEQELLAMETEKVPHSPASSVPQQQNISEKLNRINQQKLGYANLMTSHEKSLMTKIQLKQLSTGNKFLDDYYYNAVHQKSSSSTSSDSDVRLPALIRRTAPKLKRSMVSLDSALGKASMSSVRAQRKIRPVAKEAEFSIKASAAMHLRVLTKIESLLLASLDIEELQQKQNETENFEDELHKLKAEIVQELALDSTDVMNKEQLFCMIHFLNYDKGQKAIKRICSYVPVAQQIILLEQIVVCLKYLDIFGAPCSKKYVQKLNFFINNAIIPFIDALGKYTEQQLVQIITRLFDANAGMQFLSNKVCLVLCCILLNALENCKTKNVELTDRCADLIFDHIEGNAVELFRNAKLDDEVGFYSWQFLSFLAGFIKDEQRKTLVIELKDYILQTVMSEDQNKIKNLNLFLNTLGLDSSQLKS